MLQNRYGDITVRYAQEHQLLDVGTILHNSYVEEGIISPRQSGKYYGKVLNPNGQVLIAENAQEDVAATLGRVRSNTRGSVHGLPLATSKQFRRIMQMDLDTLPSDTDVFELTAFAANPEKRTSTLKRLGPLLGDIELRSIRQECQQAYVGIVTHPKNTQFYTNRFGFSYRATATEYSVQDKQFVPAALLVKRLGSEIPVDIWWPKLMQRHDRKIDINASRLQANYQPPSDGIRDVLLRLANAQTPEEERSALEEYHAVRTSIYDASYGDSTATMTTTV